MQYRSRGGRWTTANTIVLCRACHREVHERVLVIMGANANDHDSLTVEHRS